MTVHLVLNCPITGEEKYGVGIYSVAHDFVRTKMKK